MQKSYNLKETEKEASSVDVKNPQMHFLAHKAGMDNIDKAEIGRKVHEASKDSEYYKKQQKRTDKAKQKGIELAKKVKR